MRPLEHLHRYCKCWQSSLARRITIYFSVFGLVVFAVTALLYIMSSQTQFTRATAQLIRNQVKQIEGSSEPDFIWRRVGGPLPGLIDLTRMLANFSASFYSVSDIGFCVRSVENGLWYHLYFDDSGTLRKREPADAFLAKLKFHDPSKFVRALIGHFRTEAGGEEEVVAGAMPAFLRSKHALSMFADIAVARVLFRAPDLPPDRRSLRTGFSRARGDLSRKSSVAYADEVGSLAKSFNTTIDGLREWRRVKLIEFAMEKGRAIQQESLPQQLPQLKNWEIAACFYPAGRVSGDFYDAFLCPMASSD